MAGKVKRKEERNPEQREKILRRDRLGIWELKWQGVPKHTETDVYDEKAKHTILKEIRRINEEWNGIDIEGEELADVYQGIQAHWLEKYDPEKSKLTTFLLAKKENGKSTIEKKIIDLLRKAQPPEISDIDDDVDKEFLTPEEVADRVNKPLHKVERWIDCSKIVTVNKGGEELITRDEFMELVKDLRRPYVTRGFMTENVDGEEYNELEQIAVESSGGGYHGDKKARPRSEVHKHGAADCINSWYTLLNLEYYRRLLEEIDFTDEELQIMAAVYDDAVVNDSNGCKKFRGCQDTKAKIHNNCDVNDDCLNVYVNKCEVSREVFGDAKSHGEKTKRRLQSIWRKIIRHDPEEFINTPPRYLQDEFKEILREELPRQVMKQYIERFIMNESGNLGEGNIKTLLSYLKRFSEIISHEEEQNIKNLISDWHENVEFNTYKGSEEGGKEEISLCLTLSNITDRENTNSGGGEQT